MASPSGEITEGVFSADSESRLRHDFEDKGLYVLSLQPKGAIGGLSIRLPQRSTIPQREFLVFNQELATLLKAGMPLVQSLDLLKRRVESPVFKGVLEDVHQRVRSGSALSEAFGAHENVIPTVYTASLVAGERSGNLDSVLRRFVEYSKVVATVKRKTMSALIYPSILVALSLGVVTVIVTFAFPAFGDFYNSFGTPDKPVQLPALTRLIMALSHFMIERWVLIGAVALALIASFAAWVRRPEQKARFDHLLLGVPLLGEVARKFATSQMARTLATLLGGGLPLVNALAIATRAMGNQYMAGQLAIVSERVREGESFAVALDARKVFPDVAVKMAEVGESTGALQEMLNTVADFYDEEIATNMDRFVTLIEPSILVTMGVVIAGLVLALYMPLFQLSTVLSSPGS